MLQIFAHCIDYQKKKGGNTLKHNPVRSLRALLNRRFFIALLIIAQLVLITATLFRYSHLKWLQSLLTLFSIITALHLLTRRDKSAYKLSLVFLILLLPIFGGVFYWIFHFQTTSVGFRKRLEQVEQNSRTAYQLPNDISKQVFSQAVDELTESRKLLRYMDYSTPFPVYSNTESYYYPGGADMLPALLEDLKKAERYIFMEYFIIEEGEMWNLILEVLRERVKAGVDVRIIYDDLGCFLTLPSNYAKTLRSYGIQCQLFNPFHPFLTSIQNNRDHRKITVVDGKIAYTGGINLADEYIGKKIKHGTWKDSAIRLYGDGAWSFTVMFLQYWSFLSRKKEADYEKYRPTEFDAPTSGNGWVQPYTDSPMDRENVGEHVYHQITEQAQQYLYITTPYLTVNDGMLSALERSAKSGVDVRIITPEIPDKKLVHFTSRSYYRHLIRAGVKIYEYRGGFMHAKLFVSDDKIATVGTANLDFRSLYLHFECGTCLYQTNSIADIKNDYLHTLKDCRQIIEQDCKVGLFKQFLQSICRLFAPLM